MTYHILNEENEIFDFIFYRNDYIVIDMFSLTNYKLYDGDIPLYQIHERLNENIIEYILTIHGANSINDAPLEHMPYHVRQTNSSMFIPGCGPVGAVEITTNRTMRFWISNLYPSNLIDANGDRIKYTRIITLSTFAA